ncbi:SGNH/GDSL hydrolase family protein [Rhodococcus sp. X156]|uniref:SGNH/GDSL hydrolase family protein n=1 Tax=Rhodococcus sp. X156 TaxID=2499145 RepID=UPI0013E3B6D8|nr:SGNH/GDSL hydrolase family protein [Rhodococcus sp. X156]
MVALILGLGAPLHAEAAGTLRYVALGDSFAAGPGLAPITDGACGRGQGYPEIAARALGATTFTNATCSGARVEHMAGVQPGSRGPQLDALRPDTDLVTLNLGLNDSYVLWTIQVCAYLQWLAPGGAPCTVLLNPLGFNLVGSHLHAQAGSLDQTLQAIHQRSPRAKVLVVGVPAVVPDQPSACPDGPYGPGDMPYLSGVVRELNTMLRARAAANAATFVDTYTPSVGHDACQQPGIKWMEGPALVHEGVALHPNHAGMAASATAVVRAAQG